MPELYCPIRAKWVVDNPEEIVRQRLIHQMIQELEYPKEMISVETALGSLPHLSHLPSRQLPKRRADLIVWAAHLHPSYPLYPLLLIECKSVPLTAKSLRQLVGYNYFLKAIYAGLVNGKENCLLHSQRNEPVKGEIPSYPSLINGIQYN